MDPKITVKQMKENEIFKALVRHFILLLFIFLVKYVYHLYCIRLVKRHPEWLKSLDKKSQNEILNRLKRNENKKNILLEETASKIRGGAGQKIQMKVNFFTRMITVLKKKPPGQVPSIGVTVNDPHIAVNLGLKEVAMQKLVEKIVQEAARPVTLSDLFEESVRQLTFCTFLSRLIYSEDCPEIAKKIWLRQINGGDVKKFLELNTISGLREFALAPAGTKIAKKLYDLESDCHNALIDIHELLLNERLTKRTRETLIEAIQLPNPIDEDKLTRCLTHILYNFGIRHPETRDLFSSRLFVLHREKPSLLTLKMLETIFLNLGVANGKVYATEITMLKILHSIAITRPIPMTDSITSSATRPFSIFNTILNLVGGEQKEKSISEKNKVFDSIDLLSQETNLEPSRLSRLKNVLRKLSRKPILYKLKKRMTLFGRQLPPEIILALIIQWMRMKPEFISTIPSGKAQWIQPTPIEQIKNRKSLKDCLQSFNLEVRLSPISENEQSDTRDLKTNSMSFSQRSQTKNPRKTRRKWKEVNFSEERFKWEATSKVKYPEEEIVKSSLPQSTDRIRIEN